MPGTLGVCACKGAEAGGEAPRQTHKHTTTVEQGISTFMLACASCDDVPIPASSVLSSACEVFAKQWVPCSLQFSTCLCGILLPSSSHAFQSSGYAVSLPSDDRTWQASSDYRTNDKSLLGRPKGIRVARVWPYMSLALNVALLSGRQTSVVVSPDTCVQERASQQTGRFLLPRRRPFTCCMRLSSFVAFTCAGRI